MMEQMRLPRGSVQSEGRTVWRPLGTSALKGKVEAEGLVGKTEKEESKPDESNDTDNKEGKVLQSKGGGWFTINYYRKDSPFLSLEVPSSTPTC